MLYLWDVKRRCKFYCNVSWLRSRCRRRPVDSGGLFPLKEPSPGISRVSDQIQATKVRRAPRGAGHGVGRPPGEPSCARGHCLVYLTSRVSRLLKVTEVSILLPSFSKRGTFTPICSVTEKKLHLGEHSRLFPVLPLFPFLSVFRQNVTPG